ncbi:MULTISPECIES: helix-turn-helix domain-containing protein [unclassified Ruegeria]|uniref:AraC family transcriptional regulator n=1 Tax=unclassified Ruegeria TaxID=2625375 RepID=UPI0014929E3F|nr:MULTISPECIES: helix-turn-helix domain-containing protein [unclassified Ruegeria]NOD85219.1 helix-turn-helix domain-containing protein [Ruegeria sp. HKCCD6119]
MHRIKKSTKLDLAPPEAPRFFAATFRDPNQIAAISKWDMDFRQIEDGEMQADFKVRSGPLISVMKFGFSRRVHQIGASPKGHITFGIPTHSRLTDWNGTSIETPPFLSFGSGDEFDCISDSGFGGYTMTVETENAMKIGEKLGIAVSDTEFRAFLLPATPPDRSAALLNDIQTLLANPNSSEQGETHLIEEILRIALGGGAGRREPRINRKALALAAAIDRMTATPDENVPISEICGDISVSLRTLERAFNEKFGIGPKAYYTRLRLNRVRSLLAEQGKDLSISDAANRYGFWHIGQFSQDYKKCFGELPSATVD